jgi:ElaB/YqjD/DUF883 family membrane-anchored ribosome-binding protein
MENSDRLVGDTDGNGALTRGIKHAESGAHHTIDKAAEAARPAVDRIASGAHHAVDGVANAANQASETLSAKGKQIKEAQAHILDYSREYMREHPVAALGIAAAAGFVLSSLLRSR